MITSERGSPSLFLFCKKNPDVHAFPEKGLVFLILGTTFRFFHPERSALFCHPERSAILDNSDGTVVKYAYDAFGNCKVLLGMRKISFGGKENEEYE